MNDPAQWTADDIAALMTDEVSESLNLDYKAAPSLTPKTEAIKKEVSKDVSAFANSAGGVIVYGLIEQGHLPKTVDPIDPTVVTREWLDQVIASRIQQRIDGVRINQVAVEGGVVYVVVIPQSDRAPHMASDHRYYKRFEFQSVPMEEYEVRDVANRARGPELSVDVAVPPTQLTYPNEGDLSDPVEVRAHVANASVVPAEHAVFHWLADSRLQGAPSGFKNKQTVKRSTSLTGDFEAHIWQCNWGTPGKMPIWQDMNFALFDDKYEVRLPRGDGNYLVGWRVRAPLMTKASGGVLLTVTDGNVTSSRVELDF